MAPRISRSRAITRSPDRPIVDGPWPSFGKSLIINPAKPVAVLLTDFGHSCLSLVLLLIFS
jgi:hypothetical protein